MGPEAELLRQPGVGDGGTLQPAVEVVDAEPQRHLRHFDAGRDPERFHVRDVVEHQAADRDVLEVVEPRRGGAGASQRPAQFVGIRVVRERDVAQEPAGLVLQRAQCEQMIDAVLERLDVPVEHRAVRWDAELVGFAMDREPFVATELAVGDRRARGRREHLGAAAWQRVDAGFLHFLQNLDNLDTLDPRQMRHLNRRERLDHDAGMPLLESLKHVRVVRQLQLRVQSADDMEFAGRVLARRVRLGEHLLQAARVVAVFLGHPRERAEHAGVAQDADVGGIDVLVRGEVHAVAVAPGVGEVREVAEGEQIVRCEKREAILARQPFASLDFRRGRPKRHVTLRTASVTLWPPNPNEFDNATSSCRCTALFGAESRSQAGSGLN